MAQEGNLMRRCSDKALKIEDIIRGFVFSILSEEDLFEDEANVIGSVLRQTEAELKNRLELLRRLEIDTPSRVASALERDDNLAGHRCAHPEGEVGICQRDHPELMDLSLWETLPAEVVERICALLPVSKILELVKLCEPWSRLPTATRFRQLCAQAHGDLFGIVMLGKKSGTYRLAIYDTKHEEWSHSEMSSMPFNSWNFSNKMRLVFGHDGGLMCVTAHDFYELFFYKEIPRILVFNPLTGDKKYIRVSSFTASIEERVYAVLLQLIMDEELGCYKLILVTEIIKPSGGRVYHSESYDSVSGVWSTLDSGFVYGDGVLGEKRYHVCFDCTLKTFCRPAEYWKSGESATNLDPHVYFVFNVHPKYFRFYDPYYSSVRDHRFKLELIEVEMGEGIFSYSAEIAESVWLNGWHDKSRVKLAKEIPYLGFKEARLLACTRYVLLIRYELLVASPEDGKFGEDWRLHLTLYDRVTCEVLNIPQSMTKEFRYDEDFMDRNLQFMCNLKWNVVP